MRVYKPPHSAPTSLSSLQLQYKTLKALSLPSTSPSFNPQAFLIVIKKTNFFYSFFRKKKEEEERKKSHPEAAFFLSLFFLVESFGFSQLNCVLWYNYLIMILRLRPGVRAAHLGTLHSLRLEKVFPSLMTSVCSFSLINWRGGPEKPNWMGGRGRDLKSSVIFRKFNTTLLSNSVHFRYFDFTRRLKFTHTSI